MMLLYYCKYLMSDKLINTILLFLLSVTISINLVGQNTAKSGDGSTCSNAIIITLPDDAPYLDENRTNCGLGNNYSSIACGGSYFNGEDIIYKIDVSESLMLTIELLTSVTYTGIALLDDCPDTGNCIEFSTGSSGNKKIENVFVNEGSYYLIIDTWPSPDCIDDFDLAITT